MAKITVIQPTPTIHMKKRVCAYVRVSTDKAAMLHSLSAQVSYYNRLIQERPEWLFAGIYADNTDMIYSIITAIKQKQVHWRNQEASLFVCYLIAETER